ncbi:Piwi-domain-containing protein [Coprinopsis marcescibilis]|uniref:Piwi-domain-containing protein n=1 Tax=Coprinopsis marcescibilis TaxID=230819 RepID=A0A5C3L904_COPMA|nr:Piwi-domain-containing protein [Coprinopsis marcescibilis]
MNSYRATAPDKIIYQYDASEPPLLKLPLPRTHEIVEKLKADEGAIFKSAAWFDGRALMYATEKFDLGAENSKEFQVAMPHRSGTKPPKVYKVTITKVGAECNPETLQQFMQGKYAQDETIQMAEMAMNIAFRMIPYRKYICNKRSFFSPEGRKPIGGGLEVWRGFFQSVRPSIGGLLVNLDVSTTVFFKPGPFIGMCLEFLGYNNDMAFLDPKKKCVPQIRARIQKFASKVKLVTKYGNRERFYRFERFTVESANDYKFEYTDPTTGRKSRISVAEYYRKLNVPLRHPTLVCVKVGDDAAIPIELFDVVPGQFARIEINPDQTRHVVEFSTMRPEARFDEIKRGYDILSYGQSDSIRQLGMTVDTTPIEVDARVLPPPIVKCGGVRQDTVRIANGAWNMLERKYAKPAKIQGFIIAIFERDRFFNEHAVTDMVTKFIKAANDFGVVVEDKSPVYKWITTRPQSEKEYADVLKGLGREYVTRKARETKNPKHPGPSLLLAILPPNSADVYNGVKRFGDVTMGIPNQCLLSKKCNNANHQYWANVMLKVNVKLGGINFYPQLADTLMDNAHPTIVMGADAIHPPPGTVGRPSVTAVVSSLDVKLAKYVANSSVQEGRQEMIADLRTMCKEHLENWKLYQTSVERQTKPPEKLFMFRDGVSEGEFKIVLEKELKEIKAACKDVGYSPKITFVVVGKRHHHRGKPKDARDGDRSGNVPAGTTIDTQIVHPLEFDYYQYTHGGLLGTSRPAHYTENMMGVNRMQVFGLEWREE